jgi:hypothetical protein
MSDATLWFSCCQLGCAFVIASMDCSSGAMKALFRAIASTVGLLVVTVLGALLILLSDAIFPYRQFGNHCFPS